MTVKNNSLKTSEMLCTVVEIDEKVLFEGAKVMNRQGLIKEIFVIPADKTISQCVKEGLFDLNHHVDYDTVMLNKTRFELIPDEFVEMIGKKVDKQGRKLDKLHLQPKPFKSGFLVNTVKEIIKHEKLPNEWAFTFEEDDSYVSCKTCRLIN